MLYGKYRFECELVDEAQLPAYKGSTFRGLFGHALKKVVCALKRQECETCILRSKCLYVRVFETPLSLQMPDGSRISSPPHPFVMEPPLTDQSVYEKGSSIDCDLILFGEVNNSLPYFVYAFDQMGEIGLGKRINGKRGRFTLKEVHSNSTRLYSHSEQKLTRMETIEDIPGDTFQDTELEGAPNRKMKVTVTLETPLRLKFENKLKGGAELPFHVLVRAMLRRLSSLYNVYGEGEPSLDYRGLVERASNVGISKNNLSWYDWRRYSNRHEQKMLMGGMVGSVTYEGELGEYLPLLAFTKKTHLGKNTSFGLGKVNIEKQGDFSVC